MKKSIYSRIDTGYAFTRDMNGELEEKFNGGDFTQASAILKLRQYSPKIIIVQYLPVRERKEN